MTIHELITRDDLAELMRVDVRTINVWTQQGMPKESRGKYKLSDCVRWYIDRISADRGGGDLHDERKKLVVQQRERFALDNAQKRGELVDIEIVEELLNRVGVICATQLDGLAPRSAAKLATLDDPTILQRVLFDECREIRSAISSELTHFASDRIGGTDSGAAAKPKRRAMG